MAEPIDTENTDSVTATGLVDMQALGDAKLKKVPTRAHYHWSLTSIKTGADTATVTLKGTNNPDPASTVGETLITNTHAGADQQDGSAASKAYKYVFVHVTAIAGQNFAAGDIKLLGTGYSG